MTVQISDLSRHYGRDAALAGIDLYIADGEFLALLGPSGAGKTTLLRLIAGLDRPDSGTLLIDGVDVRALAPRERRIGFVFQNYALFRHMTVARNIAFGLAVKPRRQRPSPAQIAARVDELLDLMQLSGLGGRFPAQLSGGQRQRVALARALATEPRVLLLDEPFGALDAKVRGELRDWLRGLQRRLGLTTIFVTHDQHEAFQLADRLAILDAGRIEQIDTPAGIRDQPATHFVRAFLGAADPPDQRPAVAEPVFVLPEPYQPACCAAGHRRAAVTSTRGTRGPTCDPGTPRRAGLPFNAAVPAEVTMVATGELWLMGFAGADSEPTTLERTALARTNVIVYDRVLSDVVAAVMSPGGYAEPTDGDGLARSLHFARDGWSVVRLIERPSSVDRNRGLREWAEQLRRAGASSDWRLWRLAERDGHWLSSDCGSLDDAVDVLSLRGSRAAREVIVISAPPGAAPALCAVASNGLAG
jgi:sulfate ABC transporter ATP-binding protein